MRYVCRNKLIISKNNLINYTLHYYTQVYLMCGEIGKLCGDYGRVVQVGVLLRKGGTCGACEVCVVKRLRPGFERTNFTIAQLHRILDPIEAADR